MHYGFNGFSMAISAFDSGYLTYQGEYLSAVQQLATTAFYMGLPKAMGYIGVPYLGFAYSTVMVTYSGYNAIANLYSFYNEYNSEDSNLSSATAYKGLLEALGETPLGWLYDFSSNAKSYQIKINNLNLSNEKKILENKLKEEKGELGEKLYKYIYKPLIEEKYELQDKILHGEITEEKANILKAKQISITTEDKTYDYCMEIKNLSKSENSKEHYYCYDEKQEALDHIEIFDNVFEVLEGL
jgi:hypothetical protein